jgi:hypothetical protein
MKGFKFGTEEVKEFWHIKGVFYVGDIGVLLRTWDLSV